MLSLYCRILLFISLPKSAVCYASCGEIRNVTGVEGEDAILQVTETGVTEISWLFNGSHIATTKPGENIDIKSRLYKTKLYNGRNGSLGIAKLNMKDGCIISANIFHEDDNKDCHQLYRLTVSKGEASTAAVVGGAFFIVVIILVFVLAVPVLLYLIKRKKRNRNWNWMRRITWKTRGNPNDMWNDDNAYCEIEHPPAGSNSSSAPTERKKGDLDSVYVTIKY